MERVIISLLVLIAVVAAEETCLTSDEEPYLMFGTKTAYEFSNKGIPINRVHEIVGCQPQAVWLLNRHGSHNPEADEIEDLQRLRDLKTNIATNYRDGNFRNTPERMCKSDVNLIEMWQWNERQNLTHAGNLTSSGYIATQQLARAWKQRFPGVLTDNYRDYMFKFVDEQRTKTTYNAFTDGLFRSMAEGYDIPKESDEKLLQPFKFCSAWTKNVEQNNNTYSQKNIFESKSEFKQMISNVSSRLGFNYDIDGATIQRMYQMCRYNKAWAIEQISPWCAAFSRENLKLLEYAEDLELYYKYGYGSDINQKLGCTLVKDMMNFFRKHVENVAPQQPRTMVYLTDSQMMLLMTVALGAHRDTVPLTGDNYHSPSVQSRKWSSSAISPFNANLAAVLYKCETNGNFQVKEQHQILFLENEKQMNLEGCRLGLCDWSFIKTKFAPIADKCDLKFCNGATAINGLSAIILALFTYFIRFTVL